MLKIIDWFRIEGILKVDNLNYKIYIKILEKEL